MTNTNLLKAKIIEKGFTLQSIAEAVGISHTSMSYKINNKRCFTAKEIYDISEILDIDNKDAYFFAWIVDKMATYNQIKTVWLLNY